MFFTPYINLCGWVVLFGYVCLLLVGIHPHRVEAAGSAGMAPDGAGYYMCGWVAFLLIQFSFACLQASSVGFTQEKSSPSVCR